MITIPITILNAPNRNGCIYTSEHFADIFTKETYVVVSNSDTSVELDISKIMARVIDVRVIKTTDGDVLMGEVIPVYNTMIGSKEVIDQFMDLLQTGQAYLAQCGIGSLDSEGNIDSSYKFSHWLYSTQF